jgi:predicted flap endonuclease-1-like 5' DNA nuclease
MGLIIGLLVGWWWASEERREASPANTAPVPPPSRPSPRPSKQKDSLVEIEGIGPAYERALNALGIFSFEQLASQDAASLASRLSARLTAERIRRERWIEQAKSRL